jgi:hypothetical protein
MPHDYLNDTGGNAHGHQQSACGMPEGVEVHLAPVCVMAFDPCLLQIVPEPPAIFRDATRQHPPATIAPGVSPFPEHGDKIGMKRNASGLSVFGCGSPNRHARIVNVKREVPPFQSLDFTPPKTREEREGVGDATRKRSARKQLPGFLDGQGATFEAPAASSFDPLDSVQNDQLHSLCLSYPIQQGRNCVLVFIERLD